MGPRPIPFFRPPSYPERGALAREALQCDWLTSGPLVAEFEEQFSALVGGRSCVPMNSCTAALHVAVTLAGVGPGDRVLVPAMTFAATAEVVLHAGAEVVLTDVDETTLAWNAQLVADAAERHQPKAGIGVHYGGQAIDFAAMVPDGPHGSRMTLIEDAAHALPAGRPDGSIVGGSGRYVCFSFYANKTMTTAGEGGLLVCDDEDYDAARELILHGLSRDAWGRFQTGQVPSYDIARVGYKYNLTEVAAAMGLEQLPHVRRWRDARARLAGVYDDALTGASSVEPIANSGPDGHAWHLYVVRFADRATRDRAAADLQDAGVGISLHYRPLHMHTLYRERYGFAPDAFPVALDSYERMLSLPIYPDLADEDAKWIAQIVTAA